MRVVGRPKGHKLSEASKRAISISKTGQRHSQATKDKISRSLLRYFRCLNPLSSELKRKYLRDSTASNWINKAKHSIDSMDDVITEKSMRSCNRMEISCGNTIDLFSHNITPELELLVKEFCIENNITMDELMEYIDKDGI